MPTVEPIPGEARRYFVQSRSRPDVRHVVDLDDDGKPGCGCEDVMAKGKKTCWHIKAAQTYEQTIQTKEA